MPELVTTITADDVKAAVRLLGKQQAEAMFGEWLRGIVESAEYGRCREAMEGLGITVPTEGARDVIEERSKENTHVGA